MCTTTFQSPASGKHCSPPSFVFALCAIAAPVGVMTEVVHACRWIIAYVAPGGDGAHMCVRSVTLCSCC